MPRRRQDALFEIWQVGSRIHSEANAVRLRILHLLEQRPRRLGELVAATKKAKSTLSALHLRPLLAAGLIEESTDARDARAKIYRGRGHRLGSSAVDAAQLRDAVLTYVQSTSAVPLGSLLSILDPVALVQSGARSSYLDALADRVGNALQKLLTTQAPPRALAELATVLERAGLADPDAAGVPRARDARLARFVDRLVHGAVPVARAAIRSGRS